jgi:hypothetical protein
LLMLFPNIWTVPHFQRIYYLSLLWFCPAFWTWNMTIYRHINAWNKSSALVSASYTVCMFVKMKSG